MNQFKSKRYTIGYIFGKMYRKPTAEKFDVCSKIEILIKPSKEIRYLESANITYKTGEIA